MEVAIALYGDGDLEGARVALAELVQRFADDARARRYLRWVERALEEERAALKLDADAVRAVSEALAPWTESVEAAETPVATETASLTPIVAVEPAPVAPVPVDDAWSTMLATPDPTASTPSPEPTQSTAVEAAPAIVEAVAENAPPIVEAAPAVETAPPVVEAAPAPALPPSPAPAWTPPFGTITGMPPLAQLTPLGPVNNVGEEPANLANDWYANPTGPNLPPLDVPELDEEQIAAIAALNQSQENERVERRGTEPGGPSRFATQRNSRPPSSLTLSALKPQELPTENEALERRTPRGGSGLGTIDGLAPPLEFDFLETNPRQQAPVESPPPDETPAYTAKPFVRVPSSAAVAGTDPAARLLAQSEQSIERGELAAALSYVEEGLSLLGGLTGTAAAAHLPSLERIFRGLTGPTSAMIRVGEARPDATGGGALDPRAAFLLSRIDGTISIEDLLDVSGMPMLPALRLLAQLIVRGVVVKS